MRPPTKTLTLTVPDECWEAIGWNNMNNDEEAEDRLLAQVCINGTMHHLEAYRVADRDDFVTLHNPEMEEELMPKLQDLYDGAYDTVTIRGKKYALFMFPHAA